MRDYAEQVRELRDFAEEFDLEDHVETAAMLANAADAIEELLAENKEILYRVEIAENMIAFYQEGKPLPNVPKWISVEERLPEDWKPVLAYDPIGYGEIGIAFIIGSLNTVVWRGVGFTNTAYPPSVTHWMPLPEPPKEVE